MMTSRTGSKSRTKRCQGFTLIELMLVMAILIVVMSLTGASLTSFFRGRAIDAEVRRFVTLTRHAQSRAVGEGLPMLLWIDPRERKYGVKIAAGFSDKDNKAVEYFIGRDIEVEVAKPVQGALLPVTTSAEQGLRFAPDGVIDENNPEYVAFKPKDGDPVFIAPNANRLNYEINTNNIFRLRR